MKSMQSQIEIKGLTAKIYRLNDDRNQSEIFILDADNGLVGTNTTDSIDAEALAVNMALSHHIAQLSFPAWFVMTYRDEQDIPPDKTYNSIAIACRVLGLEDDWPPVSIELIFQDDRLSIHLFTAPCSIAFSPEQHALIQQKGRVFANDQDYELDQICGLASF
jgi:hypothetical protein